MRGMGGSRCGLRGLRGGGTLRASLDGGAAQVVQVLQGCIYIGEHDDASMTTRVLMLLYMSSCCYTEHTCAPQVSQVLQGC